MSRGPGRVERAFTDLINSPPASDTHPDGLGPVGITVIEAAKLIFSTDQPTVAQKSSVHRVRLRLMHRGEAIDAIYGGSGDIGYVRIARRGVWYTDRPISRPRTPQEQTAVNAYALKLLGKAARIMDQ
jgi:hypothetical protein